MKNNAQKPYSISIRVDPDIARPLRICSIDTGLSINRIINDAVRDWLRDKMLMVPPPGPNTAE